MSGLTPSLAVAAATSLFLVLAFLVAGALSGWYEERARRALAAVRRGAELRAGFGAFQGEARPLDGRPGGLLVTTTLTQVRFGGGAWRDSGRETTGTPFALVLESGEEIEVDPRDAVLADPIASSPDTMGVTRDIVTRVSTGDVIWATGILTRRRDPSDGAYRSSAARRRLIAPRRGRVVLGPESPLPRWQALAHAHQRGGYLAAGSLAVLHVAAYRTAAVALFTGDRAALYAAPWDPGGFPAIVLAAAFAVAVTVFGWGNLVAWAKRSEIPGGASRRRA